MTCIYHGIHAGDSGRAVSYDNAGDGHYRHYFGVVDQVDVNELECAGLATVTEKVLPGHGRMKEVHATASRFRLHAEVV